MAKSIKKAAKIATKKVTNNGKSNAELADNDRVYVPLNAKEMGYASKVISIMKNVRYNGIPLAQKGDMTLSGVAKKGFLMILNIYSQNILANDSVIRNFQDIDNEILRDFIAFRAEYLDMNVDDQLANLVKERILTMPKQKQDRQDR